VVSQPLNKPKHPWAGSLTWGSLEALLKQKDTVRAMAKHTVHALLLLHLALRIACGRCEKKVAVVPGPVGRGPAGQLALPAAAPVLLNRPLSVAVAAVKAEAKKAKQAGRIRSLFSLIICGEK